VSNAQEQTGPYYVIRHDYAGPNPAWKGGSNNPGNRTHYTIETEPGRKNLSGEVCTDDGEWLGTTNDWSATAGGEYATLEAAREAIFEGCDEVRENWENSGIYGDELDENVAEVWVPVNRDDNALFGVDWDAEGYPEVELKPGAVWLYCVDPATDEGEASWRRAAAALDVEPGDADYRNNIIEHLQALGWTVESEGHADFWYCVGRPPETAVVPGDGTTDFAGTIALKVDCLYCGTESRHEITMDNYDKYDDELECPRCHAVLWARVKVAVYATEDERDGA
jgi:hypothetical protein